MPHRVTNLFRSSSNSLDTSLASQKPSATARSRDLRMSTTRSGLAVSPDRLSSYAGSVDDNAVDEHSTSLFYLHNRRHRRMTNESARSYSNSSDHSHHRLGFSSLHIGRSSKENHAPPAPPAEADISWKIESPPAVFYGDQDNSSGALVSGQLFLNVVREDGLDFEAFSATLKIHVTHKKPFTPHCTDCANQYTELKTWKFLQAPVHLAKGTHAFPFSVLLGGHLPATMDGALVSISYEFQAQATPKSSSAVRLDKVLDVKRSLPPPEAPHHSVRVFPPTNIKASVVYPQVIHPFGTNTLTLRLDGLSKVNTGVKTVETWKLKKLTWKLEETTRTVAPACARHSPKDAAADEAETPAKKGISRADTRVVGEHTLTSGWKADYSTGSGDSTVELELDYAPTPHPFRTGGVVCDLRSRDGSEVTHQLMVEMVVSQEWAPQARPGLVTQTGVGRVLRMHFSTICTERGGIGVSWDKEAPPIYQDVPPSPPAYSRETRLAGSGDSIEEHIESLDADPIPTFPGTGRSISRAGSPPPFSVRELAATIDHGACADADNE